MEKYLVSLRVPCLQELDPLLKKPGAYPIVSRDDSLTETLYGLLFTTPPYHLLKTLLRDEVPYYWRVERISFAISLLALDAVEKEDLDFPLQDGDRLLTGYNSLRTIILIKMQGDTLSDVQQYWVETHADFYRQQVLGE